MMRLVRSRLAIFPLVLSMVAVSFTVGVLVDGNAAASRCTLEPPTNVVASEPLSDLYLESIEVRWSPVAQATSYKIYRATSSGGTYRVIFDHEPEMGACRNLGTSCNRGLPFYEDTEAEAGASYWYKVQACDGDCCSELSEADSGWWEAGHLPNGIPGSVECTQGTYSNAIGVTWNSVSGATGYTIYRASAESGEPYVQIGRIRNPECCPSSTWDCPWLGFDDIDDGKKNDLEPEKPYYYKVSAHNESGETDLSSWAMGFTDEQSDLLPCPPDRTAVCLEQIRTTPDEWATWPKQYDTWRWDESAELTAIGQMDLYCSDRLLERYWMRGDPYDASAETLQTVCTQKLALAVDEAPSVAGCPADIVIDHGAEFTPGPPPVIEYPCRDYGVWWLVRTGNVGNTIGILKVDWYAYFACAQEERVVCTQKVRVKLPKAVADLGGNPSSWTGQLSVGGGWLLIELSLSPDACNAGESVTITATLRHENPNRAKDLVFEFVHFGQGSIPHGTAKAGNEVVEVSAVLPTRARGRGWEIFGVSFAGSQQRYVAVWRYPVDKP